ncbi:MAG TPA: T6SS immunity protein Tli4 family protein [Stellaceae bacterium]|nr:T6SS immunity protein Tli4 family protein [Stellaceae bacterium]
MKLNVPLLALFLLLPCAGSDAATLNPRPWCFGRFYLQVPDRAILAEEIQRYDGITLRIRALGSDSYGAFLARRHDEIVAGSNAPPVKEYHWSNGMDGILFVADPSAPSGLMLEGHRSLGDNVFVATASGEIGQGPQMDKAVLKLLRAFLPDEGPDGKNPGFCIAGGVLPEPIGSSEEVHATIELPWPGAVLEIETAVHARGSKAKPMAAGAALDKQTVVLRQGSKVVAGMSGTETVIAKTDAAGISLHAHFDGGGDVDRLVQPELHFHLATGPDVGHRSGRVSQKKFLRLWDELLASVVRHP